MSHQQLGAIVSTEACIIIKKEVCLFLSKGQMKSKRIHEIIDFPKYHRKNLIDFCPESLFRLDMVCTHLSRVVLRII